MCNTGKSFGQKMHCGRVCEAILGRLGVSGGVAVGIAWAGGRRGRRRAGGGWLLRPSACRATRCATAVFRPRVGRACKTAAAGVPNGPCGNLKRGLLRGLAAGWPPGAAVPAVIRWGRGHRVQALRRRRSVVFATFLQADANFSRKSFGVSEKVITFAPAYKKHGRLAQLV